MNTEEMKRMVGTEFTYHLSYDKKYGTVKAIVAKFDKKIGLTCLATEETSTVGDDLVKYADENGSICVISVPAYRYNFKELCEEHLIEIKETGRITHSKADGYGGQNPVCPF